MNKFIRLTLVTIGLVFALNLTSCQTSTDILAGADGACGELHIEGVATDSQADVVIFKVPEGWTADDVKSFCGE